MCIDDVEFQCSGEASGIMLAPQGLIFHVRDCFITKPKDRGITSPGRGCQGMKIDRCNFVSNEQSLSVPDRTTIAFNANANDVKIRDNRVALFKHFCVIGGTGNLISGNHWFHGDSEPNGVRKGGIILTSPNCMSVITGNYIDNNFVEWTNEHSESPEFGVQLSFGGLTLTGNIFTAIDVADWFNFIVVKPYGEGHFIHGLSVVSNVFRIINGSIDRVEHVDTTFADLDYSRMRMVNFSGNTFHAVNEQVFNPAFLTHTQSAASNTWIADTEPYLPFKGRARFVDAVTADGAIKMDPVQMFSKCLGWTAPMDPRNGRSDLFGIRRSLVRSVIGLEWTILCKENDLAGSPVKEIYNACGTHFGAAWHSVYFQ